MPLAVDSSTPQAVPGLKLKSPVLVEKSNTLDIPQPSSAECTHVFRRIQRELEIGDGIDGVIGMFENDKAARTALFARKKQEKSRRNEKEKRQRRYRQRKNCKPEGDEPPGIIDERNQMARIAMADGSFADTTDMEKIAKSISDATSKLDLESTPELEAWLSQLENVAIFAYQMARARSLGDCFAIVCGYIKMYIKDKSIICELFRIINALTLAGTEDILPEAGIRDIKESWEILKTNTVFSKISFLISAAMSATACSIKEISWSPLGLKLISIEASKKQANALDIVDASIETLTWLFETGWQVFATQSLMPILYGDQSMREYNECYDWVASRADVALAGNVDDLSDFESKLKIALRKTCSMSKVKPDGPTATWLQVRYANLINIQERLICKRRNCTMRFQPVGFSLSGGTGVGKSTLGRLTMNTSLTAMGYSTDREKQITHDFFDKYQSTYTSDIEGVFLDDVANTKADHVSNEQKPSSILIKFFNNIAAQAVKAELNEKGVVFVNFKCGVVTTNVPDLDATTYSNCPESILRRLFHVEVDVKPRFRKPGGSNLDTSHPEIKNANITTDVWLINILDIVTNTDPVTRKSAFYKKIMKVKITYDGSNDIITCQHIGLESYLRVIVQLSKDHKVHQDNLLKSNAEFDSIKYCEHCMPQPVCSRCQVKPESFIDNIADVVTTGVVKACKKYVYGWLDPIDNINSLLGYRPIAKMTEREVTREVTKFFNCQGTPLLVAITPTCVFRSSLFKRCMDYWIQSAAWCDLRRHAYCTSTITLGLLGYSLYKRDVKTACFSITTGSIVSGLFWATWTQRLEHYKARYVASREALPSSMQLLRDALKPSTMLCSATIILGIKLLVMWNETRKSNLPHNSLDPTEIDNQPGWFGQMMQRMGLKAEASPKIAFTSTNQAVESLKKNIARADYIRADGSKSHSNIFFPRKSVAWIPYHAFFPNCDLTLDPTPLMTVIVKRHDSAGGKFTFKVDSSSMIVAQEVDLAICYVPNCPDISNVSKYLPETEPKGTCLAIHLKRLADCDFKQQSVTARMGLTGHKYQEFYGCSYNSELCGPGSCMSPIIKDGKSPVILGFHIGGNGTFGVAETVTAKMAKEWEEKLDNLPGIYVSANSTVLPEAQYGLPLIVGPTHAKSHALTYTADNFIDVLGSTKVRRVQVSEVCTSILSEAVMDVTGQPNIWGPPQLSPNWTHYNRVLDLVSSPCEQFAPLALKRAREDWMKPLLKLMPDFLKREPLVPLNDLEMVCGVDGKRFLDAIPMSTSMGFPLFGKKNKYFEEEILDGKVLRYPGPEIRVEMERLMSCWKAGNRAYPVFAACLKDEPTKLTKVKVRVFTAAPVAFGLYLRKYLLPIARFLSCYPRESELAVGVNAFGLQWQDLMDYSERHANGDEGHFGMDYSNFDAHMNSQMTRDTFASFIDLAKLAGYCSEDLYIMKMMMVDFCHPLIDWNGTLIMAYNMNTSGNNLTVQVNCGGNSKYMRLAFFEMYPNAHDFRSAVALTTYGDDNKGSVDTKHRKFNFLSIQEYLAKYHIIITPPDKESSGKAFFPLKELDFLKRQSSYIVDIKRSVGALDELSILKSLHCNLRSKNATQKEVAISCIEGAMHEWFAYGREVYEHRAKQMREVVRLADLPVDIPAVHCTFDSRVELWKEKYLEDE